MCMATHLKMYGFFIYTFLQMEEHFCFQRYMYIHVPASLIWELTGLASVIWGVNQPEKCVSIIACNWIYQKSVTLYNI